MEKDFGITISLIKNGEEIVQRSAESFEIAEQNLGSLRKWYQKKEFEREQDGVAEAKELRQEELAQERDDDIRAEHYYQGQGRL